MGRASERDVNVSRPLIDRWSAWFPIENQPTEGKVSWSRPNVANLVQDWLKAKWPAFPLIEHAWVTGSSVWRFLYDEVPEDGADLDVFVCRNAWPQHASVDGLFSSMSSPDSVLQDWTALQAWVSSLPKQKESLVVSPGKMTTSLGGQRHYTEFGSLDIWFSSHALVRNQLLSYPPASHAHCMAAYNLFEEQLIVLPNKAATADGVFEDLERRGTAMIERAINHQHRGAR